MHERSHHIIRIVRNNRIRVTNIIATISDISSIIGSIKAANTILTITDIISINTGKPAVEQAADAASKWLMKAGGKKAMFGKTPGQDMSTGVAAQVK